MKVKQNVKWYIVNSQIELFRWPCFVVGVFQPANANTQDAVKISRTISSASN